MTVLRRLLALHGTARCPLLIAPLYAQFEGNAQGWVIEGTYGEPGKPLRPEASSLYVDGLPALFADTEEYPRP